MICSLGRADETNRGYLRGETRRRAWWKRGKRRGELEGRGEGEGYSLASKSEEEVMKGLERSDGGE